jgi:UDP-N-acetylmuramoylalanine--D-glutamate ligase
MEKLKNTRIIVYGFAIENQATTRWLLGQGARVTIYDERKRSDFDSELINEFTDKDVEFHFGEIPDDLPFDVLIPTPGAKPTHPIFKLAKENKIPITTGINLFMERTPSRIIGVTGTKGKGTTSSLIYEMLKTDGKDAYLGGNIGTPPLSFLDKLSDSSIAVLELSSFQLMRATKSPHIAVVLMVTSEHMDYHATIEEYIEAKRGIAKHQENADTIIVNADYPNSLSVVQETPGQRYLVSNRGVRDENGCYMLDDTIVLVENGMHTSVALTSEVLLPGKHNLENVCAAVLAAYKAGASLEAIRLTLKSFRGLEHRLELVREVAGVTYYNDSFSTTPESTIAAIKAFSVPEILILGGSEKNSDFSVLGKVINEAKNIKAIIGIGHEWPKIKKTITRTDIAYIEGPNCMHNIIIEAAALASKGDVVILSPACASFDMFKNYKDRGNQFKEKVMNL